MVKVAACCMNCVYDKSANLKKYMDFIDEAASNGADLIVFPEQSLQAYLKSLSAMPFSDYEYQHDNAEVVPDGESTQALIAKAKEKNVYIIWGMTEKSAEDDVVMYNTMVLAALTLAIIDANCETSIGIYSSPTTVPPFASIAFSAHCVLI